MAPVLRILKVAKKKRSQLKIKEHLKKMNYPLYSSGEDPGSGTRSGCPGYNGKHPP